MGCTISLDSRIRSLYPFQSFMIMFRIIIIIYYNNNYYYCLSLVRIEKLRIYTGGEPEGGGGMHSVASSPGSPLDLPAFNVARKKREERRGWPGDEAMHSAHLVRGVP